MNTSAFRAIREDDALANLHRLRDAGPRQRDLAALETYDRIDPMIALPTVKIPVSDLGLTEFSS